MQYVIHCNAFHHYQRDVTQNLKSCLLLPELSYRVVFPRGPLLVSDVHPTQNSSKYSSGLVLTDIGEIKANQQSRVGQQHSPLEEGSLGNASW